MIRQRFSRRLATAGIAVSLAASIAAPAATLAAPPNWSMEVEELPGTVSPGGAAGYVVTITNHGPSNVSKLFLTTDSTNPLDTVYVAGRDCDPVGEQLFCRLGQLRRGRSVSVTVAFQTPAAGSSFSVIFEGNTGGASDSDPGSSHGDTVKATGMTSLNADAVDFRGEFVTGAQTVGNSQTLSRSNPETIRVNVPEPNIPVTVEDGPGVSGICPANLDCFSVAELHVNRGAVYDDGFSIFVQYDGSLGGPSANNLSIWHEFDAPHGTVTGEEITADCRFPGNSEVPNNVPCLIAQNLGGGDVSAIVWINENGKIFGF